MFSPAAVVCDSKLWTLFPTELGWFGLVGQQAAVCRVTIGHPNAESVRTALFDSKYSEYAQETYREDDWNPQLREQLQQFAAGEPISFADCNILLPQQTPFQKKVVSQTRKIMYGQTISYGQLAKRCGSPGAARAVGSVMSSNRLPIIIPCHRVVAANGHLGGFSAPRGVDLKQQMLHMETLQEVQP